MSGPSDGDDDGGGGGNGRDDDEHAGVPDVGVGSVRWMRETSERHAVSSAIGGFIGGLFGKILGNSTTAHWDARGDLCITAGGGLTVTIDRRHADHIADVIRGRSPSPSRWYHLGSSDLDLPIPRVGDPGKSGAP